jgi:hypothetical protein
MSEPPSGLILIVTGSTLRAEHMDRPLAYFLQTQIDQLAGGNKDRLGLVISDRYYLSHLDLHTLPLISVGGPGVNRLARKLLKKLDPVLAVQGKFFIQMDAGGNDLRASVWGLDNPQTKIAVATFAERYLPRFTSTCWTGDMAS